MAPIQLIDSLFVPTLRDAWLAGFTDAEGCFNATMTQGYSIRLRFILDQRNAQDLLVHISILFGGGTVGPRSSNASHWRYTCGKLITLEAVLAYFVLFPLKTKRLTA